VQGAGGGEGQAQFCHTTILMTNRHFGCRSTFFSTIDEQKGHFASKILYINSIYLHDRPT
jgi:hypothetical protein